MSVSLVMLKRFEEWAGKRLPSNLLYFLSSQCGCRFEDDGSAIETCAKHTDQRVELETMKVEAECNYCGRYHGKEACATLLEENRKLKEWKKFHQHRMSL